MESQEPEGKTESQGPEGKGGKSGSQGPEEKGGKSGTGKARREVRHQKGRSREVWDQKVQAGSKGPERKGRDRKGQAASQGPEGPGEKSGTKRARREVWDRKGATVVMLPVSKLCNHGYH